MKKYLFTLLFLLLTFSGVSYGQNQERISTAIQNNSGYAKLIPNAQITVCAYNSQLQCNTPVTIYSDQSLTTKINYPFYADANGNYQYYTNPGTYVEQVCAPLNQCYTYPITLISGNGGSGLFTLTTTGTSGPATYSGNILNIPQYNPIPTGTTNQLLYYAANGTTLTPLNLGTNLSITSDTLNASVSVNGTSVSSPNFNDTIPAASSGNTNILFQTDSNGDVSASIPTPSNLSVPYSAPVAGQYYILYPSSCSVVVNNPGGGAAGSCSSDNRSLLMGCGKASSLNQCYLTGSFSFTLPSGISQSSITAVYAQAWSYNFTGISSSIAAPDCYSTSVSPTYGQWGLQQKTVQLLGIPDINTLTCGASTGASANPSGNNALYFAPVLIIYYTGTPMPSTGNTVGLEPPFTSMGSGFGLSIPYDAVYDTTSTDNYSVTDSTFNSLVAGTKLTLFVSNANTSPVPTLTLNGGDSNNIVLKNNESLATGDLAASPYPNELVFNGSSWVLQNPFISSDGNPPGTTYILSGSSVSNDDGNALAPAVAITSWTCTTSVCTWTVANTTGLAANSWVLIPGCATPNASDQGIGYPGCGWTQVLASGLTSTTFETADVASTQSCTTSCGTYTDGDWLLGPQLQKQSNILNHGTVYWPTCDSTSGGYTLACMAANFAETYGSFPAGTPSAPVYFVITNFEDDGYASDIESDLQTIWADAHARNWIVVTATTWPRGLNAGASLAADEWLYGQTKSEANSASGQYTDSILDVAPLMSNGAYHVTNGGFNAQGLAYYVGRLNTLLGGNNIDPTPFQMNLYMGESGNMYFNYPNNLYGPNWNIGEMGEFNGYALNVSGDPSYSQPLTVVDPTVASRNIAWFGCDTASGGACSMQFGSAQSTNNAINWGFNYEGNGSTSSYFTISPYGEPAALSMFMNGDISIGNTTDSTKMLGVGSSNQLTIDSNGNLVTTGTITAPNMGTVTSVAQTVPSWLAVAGSPITSSGTLAISAASGQAANEFLATPSGSTGAVGLRALTTGDMPGGVPTSLTTTGVANTASLAGNILNIPQYVKIDSNSNVLIADGGPATGIPANAGITQDFLMGYQSGYSLGTYTPIVTTGSASSGSTTLTVGSATGIVHYMSVSGTGIATGTYVAAISGTTITLSAATTGAVSGNVTFVPGAQNGVVAIGSGALLNATDQTGTIAIGNDAAYNCKGNGQGSEDINGIFIGPASAYDMECAYNSDSQLMTTEPVVIGNKAAYYSHGLNSTIVMGTHNYAPDYDFYSLFLGSSQGNQFGPDGGGIGGYYSVFLGAGMFGAPPAANNTSYTASRDVYITPHGADCWYATTMNTLIGAYLGDQPTCASPVTGTRNLIVAAGDNGNDFIPNWSSGTSNVVLVTQGLSPSYSFGGNITTGNGNTAVGPGAGADITTGAQNVVEGNNSDCFATDFCVAIGNTAVVGSSTVAPTGAIQLGAGTNLTSNTAQLWNEEFYDSSGNSYATHINQHASDNFGGSCTMSAATTCTITLTSSYVAPICIATIQGTTPAYAACSVSGTTVTITASASNSDTWGAMVFGNPN